MRKMTMILLAGLAAPGMAQAVNCSQKPVQQPLQPTVIAPVAGELSGVYNLLGEPGGVLSNAYDQSQSVDQVLLRIHTESCRNVASIIPAPGVVDPNDPAAYKPRTEFDNTPWRFNMTQNGKSMTADEFTTWMKSRGVRIARGKTVAAPAAETGGDALPVAPVGEPGTDAPAVDPADSTPSTPPATQSGQQDPASQPR